MPQAAVIGTGFGGAVAACRLAQAGLKVSLFERGRRYPEGSFPRDWRDPTAGWLWRQAQGLFDVKPFSEMMVVQAAGYGGGSLIYANVHTRMPAAAFTDAWPEGYTREALDPYYDLVAYMLDIGPVRATPYQDVPPKTLVMEEAAHALGRGGQLRRLNLAVDFGDPEVSTPNRFGVPQRGCNHCGECVIGCNRRSKNTLDLNYLATAEASDRVQVHLRHEVRGLEPLATGYRVHYVDHEGEVEGSVDAEAVFVCAGAVGTTELLLRCRDEHRTLTRLSPALGARYSGNGDYLAFAFDTEKAVAPSTGPTITTGLVYDEATRGGAWFILEEGGYPAEVASLLQVLNPRASLFAGTRMLARLDVEAVGRSFAAGRVPGDHPGGKNSAVFLAMGRDLANGRIELSPFTRGVRIHWDSPGSAPLYDLEERLADDVARAMGGVLGRNPFWKALRLPITVHSLGGCVMADHPAQGVCNPDGEVYGHENLFVLDGAALPAATGVNPAHTIAAVAERNVERFLRRYTRDPDWRAPERAHAPRIEDPLDTMVIPDGGTPAPRTPDVGITFSETLRGFLAEATREPRSAEEYDDKAREARRENAVARFSVTIGAASVDSFLEDENHAATASGDVLVPGLTPPAGAPVTAGVFNLFVAGDAPTSRRMLYALPFHGQDGQPYMLTGYKDVQDHGEWLAAWQTTSTLYATVRRGHDSTGQVVAAGVLEISTTDFMSLLASLRATGGDSEIERKGALVRFVRFFLGTLFEVFVVTRLES